MKKNFLRTICSIITTFAFILNFSVTSVHAEENEVSVNNEVNYMVLVNKEHKLPEDWTVNLTLCKAKNAYGDDLLVEKEALKQFYKLQKDVLENDGVDIQLDSVYRSVEEQQKLWDDWTVEKGIDYVQKYVAVPGTSEHHTGLAIDVCLKKDGVIIDENDDMIADRESFSKVHKKLAEYGFILRFPEGKDSITGYAYEPWHFRYIGNSSIAKYITENNLTFEEYIEERYKGMADSPEWVVKLAEEKKTTQILIVAGVGKTTATISFHEKTPEGKWVEITSTPGYIGKHGLGKEKEGDGKTPIGTFSIDKAFGIADNPGISETFKYKKVTKNTYWSGDISCNYNKMVNIKKYPDLDISNSEHLIDYKYEYLYGLNITYNKECVPGKGSAIFIHCFGSKKPYTGGCISVPKDQMIIIMQYLKKDCVVEISSLETLCPELWAEWGL